MTKAISRAGDNKSPSAAFGVTLKNTRFSLQMRTRPRTSNTSGRRRTRCSRRTVCASRCPASSCRTSSPSTAPARRIRVRPARRGSPARVSLALAADFANCALSPLRSRSIDRCVAINTIDEVCWHGVFRRVFVSPYSDGAASRVQLLPAAGVSWSWSCATRCARYRPLLLSL